MGTIVSALAFTIVVFKASAAFGIVALVFGDPLIILVVLAAFRIFVEFFVVIFRAAEDIRALRDGAGQAEGRARLGGAVTPYSVVMTTCGFSRQGRHPDMSPMGPDRPPQVSYGAVMALGEAMMTQTGRGR